MPIFLNTEGQPTLGIAICARCGLKFPLADLKPDHDKPGLMVCKDDNDKKDPWRFPFTPKDRQISLPYARPDESPVPPDTYSVNSLGKLEEAAFPVDTSVRPSST